MTDGQQRALRELAELEAANPGWLKIGLVEELKGIVLALITIRIGPIQTVPDGLKLREREEFLLIIPADFPFAYPGLKVTHNRFAGFPHVVWSKTICLYQSSIEWNPSDGLFGFFDRLVLWLGRAAINDMDPVEGPLEPPHHDTNFSERPFVIRCNAPVAAGSSWLGLAQVHNFANRIELVGWSESVTELPQGHAFTLAVILPKPMPMEFPQKGAEFFSELLKQGFDRDRIIRNLALAALFTDEGEPVHLVLGLPMRRAADGSSKLHIAIWTTDTTRAKSFRNVLAAETDTEQLRTLRREISDLLYDILAQSSISWCQVLEDRSEIIVRRDFQTPAAWFRGKKILILGCGALGSWIAEMTARAGAIGIHLVDNSIVKPGLLVRQNYSLKDIGSNKAIALSNRLEAISPNIRIEAFKADALDFIRANRAHFESCDIAIDCTASFVFQMKLERDWRGFARRAPLMISLIIDAMAQRSLVVSVPPRSLTGPWGAYIQLKQQLCFHAGSEEIIDAFYSDRAARNLFQPEPGCSDPTFSGSAVDVLSVAASSLNTVLAVTGKAKTPFGAALSRTADSAACIQMVPLSTLKEVKVGHYRVRFAVKVFSEARGWVQQNNRLRTPNHETGGLLWGLWDNAIGVIWVFDASGPPPDSHHDPGHFICGVVGTAEEHKRRFEHSRGTNGFIGFWHTHPGMLPRESIVDIVGMSELVAAFGQNQKRALMVIFGREGRRSAAGVYVYERHSVSDAGEVISTPRKQIALRTPVV